MKIEMKIQKEYKLITREIHHSSTITSILNCISSDKLMTPVGNNFDNGFLNFYKHKTFGYISAFNTNY